MTNLKTEETLVSIAETSLERGEWDELPMLFVITGETMILVALAVNEPLPEALVKMAAQFRAGRFPDLTKQDVTGVVLMWEGWALKAESQAEAAENMKFTSAGGRISYHPRRVEMKGLFAVDAEGFYSREFMRGDTEIGNQAAEGGEHKGRLVDAIKDVYQALTA